MSDPLARYMSPPESQRNEPPASQGGHDEGSVGPSLSAAPPQHAQPTFQQAPPVAPVYQQPNYGSGQSNAAVHGVAPQQAQQGNYGAAAGHAAPPVAPQVPAPQAPVGGYGQQVQRRVDARQPDTASQFTPSTQFDTLTAVAAPRHRAASDMGSVDVQASGKLPSERGWRRWLYLLTRINLGLSPDEIYERELHAAIRKVVTPPPGSSEGFYLAVVNLKGGVGKTVLTILLGSIFSMIRGVASLAVDANPDAGNLIRRSRRETEKTVSQLVGSADQLVGSIPVRELTNQNAANLEVLAADDYVEAQHPFNAEDWNTVKSVVEKYYSIVLADCGTGLHTEESAAVLKSAWAVLIPCDTCIDSAISAVETVEWLAVNGYKDLAGRAVIVMNHTKRGKSSADLEAIRAKLEERVGEGRVFEMPFDNHIETGKEIDIRLVSSTVRRRTTEIGATLAQWFDKPRRG